MKSLILLTIGLLIISAADVTAQSKIIRKTVRKVIRPPIAPAPPPTELPDENAPTPPPPPSSEVQGELSSKKIGLFGWGQNCDINGAYLYNRSGMQSLLGVLAGRVNLAFSDPLLLGSKIGLAEDALEYKVGLGLAFGADVNNNPINSIPIYSDAVLYLKEKSLFGFDPYIGLGFNYNLWGTGQQSGGTGSQLYGGILLDFGSELGKTGITVGYHSIKVGSALTAEGIIFQVTQPFVL
ncbi:hypothetical protein ACFL5U_00985 [Candidatus Margulisiibacteriota bacterium]